MKRRIAAIVIAIFTLTVLAACKKTPDSSAQETTTTTTVEKGVTKQKTEADLSTVPESVKGAVFNNDFFIDADNGSVNTTRDVYNVINGEERSDIVWNQYAIADTDGDGTNELIVNVKYDDNSESAMIVFHEESGEVYAYQYNYTLISKLLDSEKLGYYDFPADEVKTEPDLTTIPETVKKAMFDNGSFIDVNNGNATVTRDKYTVIDGAESTDIVWYKYAIVDLDGDGVNELVAELRYGKSALSRMVVLHEEDGKAYAYQFAYRGMSVINTDGSIKGSSGAAANSSYKITFENGSVTEHVIIETKENGTEVEYYIGDKKVDKQEYDEYCSSMAEVTEVTWYN